MILDGQDILSDAQAITTSAASTNIFDAGPVRDVGGGTTLPLYIRCDQAAAASGAATVDFRLQGSDTSDFASPVDLGGVGPIGVAALTAGADVLAGAVSRGAKRYLRVYYTVASGPLTAGKFTAAIGSEPPKAPAYPRGGYAVA